MVSGKRKARQMPRTWAVAGSPDRQTPIHNFFFSFGLHCCVGHRGQTHGQPQSHPTAAIEIHTGAHRADNRRTAAMSRRLPSLGPNHGLSFLSHQASKLCRLPLSRRPHLPPIQTEPHPFPVTTANQTRTMAANRGTLGVPVTAKVVRKMASNFFFSHKNEKKYSSRFPIFFTLLPVSSPHFPPQSDRISSMMTRKRRRTTTMSRWTSATVATVACGCSDHGSDHGFGYGRDPLTRHRSGEATATGSTARNGKGSWGWGWG